MKVAIGFFFASVFVVAGCSGDDASQSSSGTTPSGDAGSTPGSCEVTGAIADPLPLKVTVVATSPTGNGVAVPGAAVELRAYADDAVLAKGSTSLDGTTQLSVASRAAPVMGYVRVTRSGFVTARYGYQTGFVGGVTGDITAFLPTSSELGAQAKSAGKSFDGSSTSAVGITAFDCTSKLRLVGATFQVAAGSGVAYRDGYGDYDAKLTSSTEAGSGTDFGVPPGRARVTVSRAGRSSELEIPVGTGELFGIIMSL